MRSAAVVLWMLMLVPPAIAQDFQLWNEVDLAASWKKVEFLAPFLARSDTSLPNPQLAATGITADFPLPWRLTLTGGYLFADLPQRSLFVRLPLVAVTKSGAIGRFYSRRSQSLREVDRVRDSARATPESVSAGSILGRSRPLAFVCGRRGIFRSVRRRVESKSSASRRWGAPEPLPPSGRLLLAAGRQWPGTDNPGPGDDLERRTTLGNR
jgi:hypothetical protein